MQNPTANFHDAFEGTTNSGYGVANALVKIIYSYSGYANAFNVVNEVKVYPPVPTIQTHRQAFIDTIKNPVKTIRTNAFISLLVVAILYQLANIAYFATGRFRAHSEKLE